MLEKTWLYPNEKHIYNLNGFAAVHSCRDSRGGGVAIYIRKSIKFRKIEKNASDKHYNWVCLLIGNNNLKLSAIYRPQHMKTKKKELKEKS